MLIKRNVIYRSFFPSLSLSVSLVSERKEMIPRGGREWEKKKEWMRENGKERGREWESYASRNRKRNDERDGWKNRRESSINRTLTKRWMKGREKGSERKGE